MNTWKKKFVLLILGMLVLGQIGCSTTPDAPHPQEIAFNEVAFAFSSYARENYLQALEELKPFAERGNVFAQILLGTMHEMGQGMPQDSVLAYMFYSLAAASGGVGDAAKHQARIAQSMTSKQILEGKQISSGWKPTSPLPTRINVK